MYEVFQQMKCKHFFCSFPNFVRLPVAFHCSDLLFGEFCRDKIRLSQKIVLTLRTIIRLDKKVKRKFIDKLQ